MAERRHEAHFERVRGPVWNQARRTRGERDSERGDAVLDVVVGGSASPRRVAREEAGKRVGGLSEVHRRNHEQDTSRESGQQRRHPGRLSSWPRGWQEIPERNLNDGRKLDDRPGLGPGTEGNRIRGSATGRSSFARGWATPDNAGLSGSWPQIVGTVARRMLPKRRRVEPERPAGRGGGSPPSMSSWPPPARSSRPSTKCGEERSYPHAAWAVSATRRSLDSSSCLGDRVARGDRGASRTASTEPSWSRSTTRAAFVDASAQLLRRSRAPCVLVETSPSTTCLSFGCGGASGSNEPEGARRRT